MAKRFIDSDIFKEDFTRSLKGIYKTFWIYLFCDCNHSGIWEADFEIASIQCGGKIEKEDAEKIFASKFVSIKGGAKWFLPGFITFQYKGILSLKNKAHVKPIEDLARHGLIEAFGDGFNFKLKTNNQAPLQCPSIEGTRIRSNLNSQTNLNSNTKPDEEIFSDLKGKIMSDPSVTSNIEFKYGISASDFKIIAEDFFLVKTTTLEYKEILTEEACRRNLLFYVPYSAHYKKIKNISNATSINHNRTGPTAKIITPGKRLTSGF